MVVKFMFWLCAAAALYSYFLYPGVLWALVRLRRSRPSLGGGRPGRISIIIAARNEEGKMAAKLENTLSLQPGAAEVEILVASDASDDATDQIVRSFESRGVRLVRSPERNGKEYAQALAMASSVGDVMVFSDAGTVLPPDSLRRLEEAFDDPRVGAVSSVDRFLTATGEVEGEGLYVRYEMWLRALESRVGGLVGLSGSFFAARRQVCEGWDTRSPSDFNTALSCARKGLRAISDPDVVGVYQNLANPANEYRRKVRTVVRGLTALFRNLDVLNPFRFGVFAWQAWSHKVMRWGVPFFMIGMLGTSASLAQGSPFFQLIFLGQILFYLAALLAHLQPALRRYPLIRLVYFFVQVNLAILEAVVRFASGQRMTTWQPSRR
jgi:cellulose synthase/poly-beta-1,6-N-acetylglucosamine synthase-like glycosyltransferase